MQDQPKEVLRPTDEEAIRLAKTLLHEARYGALATLDPQSGAPVATRVALATDIDGCPLILVSALSAHTGGLVGDPRCSLLVGEPGKGDPLAHPRMSIACRATKLERGTPEQARAERRYLNRQPKAKLYVGFADFSFFRLEPQSASLNGGFGKAYALTAQNLVIASPANEALAASEQSAITHMNSDHREAIAIYARAFAKALDGDWIMTGLDAEGIDVVCGEASRRIFFAEPLQSPSEMRAALVRMASEGRQILQQPAAADG